MQKNKTLNLANKSLTNSDVPSILSILIRNREINQLDLSDNFIGDAGVKKLVRSSAINNIFYLNLYNNYISDEGAIAAVVSSKGNNIASLNLGKNNITLSGIAKLATKLPGSRIMNLDVIFNPGTEDPRGCSALLAAARKHKLLQYLHVPRDFNVTLRPVLIENRKYVTATKQQLIDLINSLEDYGEFTYPVESLDFDNLSKFQEIYYNQMLNHSLDDLGKVTCRKIENYITDNYFKLTKIVCHSIEVNDHDKVSIACLPMEVIGKITNYCLLTDVKLESE